MRPEGPLGGRPWLLPLPIVPIIVSFTLWGPQVGLAVGIITAALIALYAARLTVREKIEVARRGAGGPGGILVLALTAIDDPRTAGIVAAIADPGRPQAEGGDTVLVVAPAVSSTLDRWTSDLDRARFESQRVLAVSVATLIAAGVEARGQVGDEDPIQALEDALRSFAAVEVVVVAPDRLGEARIAELGDRLELPLRQVVPSEASAGE